MGYFSIPNWTEYQHYKDRNPPWIKLHRDIMGSDDWIGWSDASRLLALTLMMIASESYGIIKADMNYIRKRSNIDGEIDLEPLVESGFIQCYEGNIAAEKIWCSQNNEVFARVYHEEFDLASTTLKTVLLEKRREEESIDYTDSFVY
jgi:hypothetical protein